MLTGLMKQVMKFIIHKKENDEKLDSIDYSQIIGPLVATIQHMDACIRVLDFGNQSGKPVEKPVEKPVGNQTGDQAGNPQTDNQVENQVEHQDGN